MNSIELDLSKPEYDEQYATQDLWQQQSASLLMKHLEHFGLEAKNYQKSASHKIHSQNIHNSILISGSRGTGKSVFLKNAHSLWNEYVNGKHDLPSLYFAPIIDPTLLQDHDSFTNVLVAHIYNQVLDYINSGSSSLPSSELQNQTAIFYKRLRSLAEAVQHSGENSEYTGLDKIIQYSSGIKIDQLFHDYVATAKIILGCDAIVLSIDDVDMALDKAYPVLEEIRRRLSCPDIIPLVSGELELYQHLVKLELTKSLSKSDKSYNDRKSSELADAYLTKILPNHYRITLKPIYDLFLHLQIKDLKLDTDDKTLAYFSYQHIVKQYFFGFVNGEEKSAEYPKPQSAREVGQFIRLITPSALINEGDELSLKHNWECLRSWSESQQHGASYVLARSAIQLLDNHNPIRLSKLLIFNIKDQVAERLPWANHSFCSEQKLLAEPFDKDKGIGSNVNLLEHLLNSKVIRSMPPLEMFTGNISITDTKAMIEKNRNTLDLYTHSAYYGTQGSQQRKIYFSKAFEILATSLLMSVSNIDLSSDWKAEFKDIISSTPFYSIHALNPTKYVDEGLTDIHGDTSIIEFDVNDCDNFAEKVIQWVQNYSTDITSLFYNESKLLATLAAVFNKTFSQLNLLREGYHRGNNPNDTLLDAILRFRYILINAFGFLLKSKNIVPANLALETKQETLRNLSKFENQSKTYQKNVGWINELKTKSIEESEENIDIKSAKFIYAISQHPIFTELGDGINIDNCIEQKSALITNQNGTSRGQQPQENSSSGKSKNKVSKHKQPILAIKNKIGSEKEYRTANDFRLAIINSNIDLESMTELFNKLEKELGTNPTQDMYYKAHWEAYLAIKNKVEI